MGVQLRYMPDGSCLTPRRLGSPRYPMPVQPATRLAATTVGGCEPHNGEGLWRLDCQLGGPTAHGCPLFRAFR